MKFGIIKERKTPPDRRVVFTPEELACLQAQYPEAQIKVESSDIRFFTDEEYAAQGAILCQTAATAKRRRRRRHRDLLQFALPETG